MNTKIAVAVGLAAMLAAIFTVPSQQAAFAADINVDIVVGASSLTDTAYAPNPVQANVGDKVIWTNQDSQPHTATAGAPGEATGMFGGTNEAPVILVKGKTQEFTFTEAGEFDYYCILHPTMVGTVMVSAGGGNGQPTGGEFTVTATHDGQNFNVTGTSETATATAVAITPSESVDVTFDGAGEVSLTLPKAMIDGINAVMAGGEEVEFTPTDAENSTTITFTRSSMSGDPA